MIKKISSLKSKHVPLEFDLLLKIPSQILPFYQKTPKETKNTLTFVLIVEFDA